MAKKNDITIIVDREKLSDVVEICKNILSSFKIDTTKGIRIQKQPMDDRLELYTTNLQNFYIGYIDIDPSSNVPALDPILVDADLLYDILKSLNSEKVVISVSDNKITIKKDTSKKGGYNVSLLSDVEKMPTMDDNSPIYDAIIELPIEEIKKGIETVMYCASTETALKSLNGILFDVDDNSLTFVGSDGYRLSLYKISTPNMTKMNNVSVIIDLKTMKSIQKFLDNSNSLTVKISISNNLVKFTIGDDVYIVRPLNETYPNYKRIINVNKSMYGTVNVISKELEDVIKESMVVSNLKVTFTFNPSDKVITVSSQSDTSTYEEDVPIELTTLQSEVTSSFNPKFVLDTLKHINTLSDEIVLHVPTNGLLPMIITPDNDIENINEIHVVMPVRV